MLLEKYIALLNLSMMTLTLFGFSMSFFSENLLANVAIGVESSFDIISMSLSINSGGISGSSACRFTIMSHSIFSTAAATLSVPLGRLGSVIIASAPNDLAACIVFSLSAAMITRCIDFARLACS